MLASPSPQCRAVRGARLSAPRRAPLRRCAAPASASAAAPSPVVILPGLGNAAEDYVALSADLTSSLGAVVRTAQARGSPERSSHVTSLTLPPRAGVAAGLAAQRGWRG